MDLINGQNLFNRHEGNRLWHAIQALPMVQGQKKYYNVMYRILGGKYKCNALSLDATNMGFGSWDGIMRFLYTDECQYTPGEIARSIVMPVICAFSPDTVHINKNEVVFTWKRYLKRY